MSFKEKSILFGISVASTFLAPSTYYWGRYEKPYDLSNKVKFAEESLITKRDKVMAREIVDLLEKKDIDKILAVAGRDHIKGISKNLSELVGLEKIE